MKVKSESEVAQSCLTLCDPVDYSLPGSSVHGTFQARVLEWGAIMNLRMLYKQLCFFFAGKDFATIGSYQVNKTMLELFSEEINVQILDLVQMILKEIL